MTAKKPTVIVISGSVGSGKSTIAAGLSRRLGEAPVLNFDHYEQYIFWPQDMDAWMKAGADPSQIRIPRLKEDLLALLDGKAVIDPHDGRVLNPSKIILLEDPSGREREETREYLDLVVYIDVPQDICVMRLVERTLDMELWNTRGSFESARGEDMVRQLNAVALWVTQYRRARAMYIGVSRIVQEKADIVVDGMKTVDEITDELLNAIKEKQGRLDAHDQ